MRGGPSELTRTVSHQLRDLLGHEPSQASLEAAFRLLAKWRAQLLANTLVRREGTVIGSGPFAGMDYAVRATEGAGAARLLGCYETTLIPVIEAIVARAYPLVIDVGSAEGYYAVGLARRMPASRILARDASPAAQAACRGLAALNNVAERVEVGGTITHRDFDICTGTDSVVICDIEGAEADLLDPVKAPGLRRADILVEVHDTLRPGLSATIAARFAASHRITTFGRSVDMAALPGWMEALSDLDRLTALWEWRAGPTPWLWMQRDDRP